MKNGTIIDQVISLMGELIEKRNNDLCELRERLASAEKKREAAALAMETATDAADVDAYYNAKTELEKASAAVEMYGAKLAQLNSSKLISEEESDKIISSVLEYGQQRREKFREDIARPMGSVRVIYDDYMADVELIRKTLAKWTFNIHPNYQSPGTTYQDGSHRSPNPVPVDFTSGPLATSVGRFLEIFENE